MPNPKAKKERSKVIRPQAKRAASKTSRKKLEQGAFYFSKRGELVIRDARMMKKLDRLLYGMGSRGGGVAAEIIIIAPVKPPNPPPPPNEGAMCGCVMHLTNFKGLPAAVNPVRLPKPT